MFVMGKKVQCKHCSGVVDLTSTVVSKRCGCGAVASTNGVIVEGVVGKDYIDVSPQLLTE